jgi:hypothetical protein
VLSDIVSKPPVHLNTQDGLKELTTYSVENTISLLTQVSDTRQAEFSHNNPIQLSGGH